MQTHDTSRPITAIVYSDGPQFEAFLQEITVMMAADGLRLAGLVQRNQSRPGRLRCDMYLQDLATGELHGISDDRGPLARGCILDMDGLHRACKAAEAGLSEQADILVLSKFGKAEMAGSGFRALIVKALEVSVPVLIGVPAVNLEPFRGFAAGLSREFELSELVPAPHKGSGTLAVPLTADDRVEDSDSMISVARLRSYGRKLMLAE